MQCDHCNARGKIIKHACPVCKGARIIEAESEISVDIDRGLPEGAELVFEGEADENPDWDAGDLVVRVRTRPYKGGFMRRGSNLYWTESISVADVSVFLSLLDRPFLAQSLVRTSYLTLYRHDYSHRPS
jgi:DnaJ-related protein SCJ1